MSFRALKILLADIQESGVDLEAALIAGSSPTVRPSRNLNPFQHSHVPGSNNDAEWEAYIPHTWEMARPTPTNAPYQNMFRSVYPQKLTPPESPFTSNPYQNEFRSVQPQLNTPPESPYSGASSQSGCRSVQSQLYTSPGALPQIPRKAVPQPMPAHSSFSCTATKENHAVSSPSRRGTNPFTPDYVYQPPQLPSGSGKRVPQLIQPHWSFPCTATQESHTVPSPKRRGTNPFLPEYVYQPPKLPSGSRESRAISNTSRVKDCVICTDEKALGFFPQQTPTSTCKHDPNTCLDCLQKYIQTQVSDGMINEQSIKCPECSNPLDLAEIQKYADPDTFKL
jgi:hypothetical protein